MPRARLRWLHAWALLTVSGVALAGGSAQPSFAPRPSWVVPLEPAAPGDDDDLPGGVEYLLLDDQIRVTADGADHWARRVRRVQGLQAIDSESQFQIDWNPAYESLTIHRVVVVRDGREIDRLEPEAVEVVRREPDFEASLLDGTLSAILVVRDVRIGDVVEHEFTISGVNPVFAGRWFGGFSASWEVPVRRLGYRVSIPASRHLRWSASGLDAPPTESLLGGRRELSWLLEDLAAVDVEADAPEWHLPGGGVALTEFESWADIVRWALPLYEAPAPAPGGEVDRLVGRLREDSATLEERALAAIRFVQDDVRYLGLELGPGSHRPSPPEIVLDRRFGDCKDKVLLLVTLLRGLGIAADPALVSSVPGDDLDDGAPSPAQFDHVIVRLQLDGRTSWIDATITAQGGRLAARHVPRYGQALVVRPATSAPEPVVPAPGDQPSTVIDSRFALAPVDAVTTLSVRTTHAGRDADDLRAELAGEGRQQTERAYAAYYARLYPSLETARPLVIRDDRDANVLVTEESYRIPEMWARDEVDGAWTATFRAAEIEELLVVPEISERESPLAVDHPRHVVHRTRIELPDDWPIADADEELESPGANYKRTLRRSGRSIELTYEWRSLVDWLPPVESGRHVAMLRRAFDDTTFELSLSTGGRPLPMRQDRQATGMNWSVLALAIMTALAGAAGSLALVLWRQPEPIADDAPPIGGGLVVVAMVAALIPVGLGASLALSLDPYGLAAWNALTLPDAPGYEPLAAPLLLLALIGSVLDFMLSVALIPLLLLRRRLFRLAFSGVALMALALLAGRAAAARLIPEAFPATVGGAPLALAAAGVLAAVAHVALSARSRATFTR